MKYKIISAFLVLAMQFSNISAQNGIDTVNFENTLSKINTTNSLIIIGEAHEVEGTYQTELFLIKELYQSGFNRIYIEGGKSEAILLNKYLSTKNVEFLNYTRAKGKNYRNFIEEIGKLKGEKKIEFEGIDFERGICLDFLFTQWNEQMKNTKLNEFKKSLNNVKSNSSPKKIKKSLLKIRNIYDENKEVLKAELGEEDEENLHQIIFNPVFEADFGISTKKRDKGMLDNILKDISKIKNSILIIGSNHLTYSNNLGSEILEKANTKLKINYFLFAYKNCSNLLKEGKIYSSKGTLEKYMELNKEDNRSVIFELKKGDLLSEDNYIDEFVLVKILNQ